MIFDKAFHELSHIELLEIMKLRQEVFMIEQQIYEVDIDSYDSVCRHLFIKRNGHIVSYARLILKDDEYYIGRIVTDKAFRKQGFSTSIIEYLKHKHESLKLSAQLQAVEFYKKLDFKPIGKKYKEAGIYHQKMVYINPNL